MNPTTPPPNPDEPEDRSLFEDFINRSLDLDGLDAGDSDDDEETLLQDEARRVLSQFRVPTGRPYAESVFSSGPFGPDGTRLPQMPLAMDARWRTVAMKGRPDHLRISGPRIDWLPHSGQLIVALGRRSNRTLQIIPGVRPGWTAVRYRAGRRTTGELIEWRGNRAALHQLQLDGKELAGFIKDEDMPLVRPARDFSLIPQFLDLTVILIIILVIVVSFSLIIDRLPLGEGPAIVELQSRIDALQEQVTTLEAQLEAGAAADGG